MDLKSSHVSPVLTDPVPVNKSRLRMHSSLLAYSQQDSPVSPGKCSRSNSRKSTGSFDDVRSNGWLDAMKASSPPRKKLLKGSSVQVASIDFEIEDYCTWMVNLLHRLMISSFSSLVGLFGNTIVVSSCSWYYEKLYTNTVDIVTIAIALWLQKPKNPWCCYQHHCRRPYSKTMHWSILLKVFFFFFFFPF